MSISSRLTYAISVAIALWMICMLTLSIASADGIALVPESWPAALAKPTGFLVLYVIAFVISPPLSERFPIKRWWQ